MAGDVAAREKEHLLCESAATTPRGRSPTPPLRISIAQRQLTPSSTSGSSSLSTPETGAESCTDFRALRDRGMAGFAGNITPQQSQAIRAYITQQAQRGKALQQQATR